MEAVSRLRGTECHVVEDSLNHREDPHDRDGEYGRPC